MKQAIIVTTFEGYTVTIDGKTKKKKGGILKQMAEIMQLGLDGYTVVDQNGKVMNLV